MLFLSERLETRLTLPIRNVSPQGGQTAMELPEDLFARLHQAHRPEFTLYAKVTELGVLETPTPAAI